MISWMLGMEADYECSGMARIFTAAPGLVQLMNGEKWSETGLPEVYQLTKERMEKLTNEVDEEAPKVAVV
jgi:hypothetical protein